MTPGGIDETAWRRLGVSLLGAAIALLSAPASAGTVEATPVPGGWNLELSLAPDQVELDAGTPRIAGLSTRNLGDGVELPAAVVSLAVPDGARIVLEERPSAPLPLGVATDPRVALRVGEREPIEVEEAVYRGLRLVRLIFHPLAVDEDGEWLLRESMGARLVVPGGGEFGRPPGGWSPAERRVLGPRLINGVLATRSDVVDTTAPGSGGDSGSGGGAVNPGVKIRVDRAGLVRVGVDELQAAGFVPGGVVPANLEVALRGQAIPSRIVGGGDGTLDPGDAVEFYADPQPGRHATDVVYWLEERPGPGLRFATRVAPPGAAPAATRFDHTEHYEEGNDLYTFGRPAEEGDPHFFWVFFGQGAPPQVTAFTHSATLTDLDSSGSGAQLRAFFAGRTDDLSANPDHRVRFFVNDVEIGETLWNGQNFHTALLPFDVSLLGPGNNDFRLEFVSIAVVDLYLLDWIEIEYPRSIVADGERLTVVGDAGGPVRYDVGGFAGAADALVLDVTDPLAPVELVGATVAGSGPFTVSFQEAAPAGKRYHVVGDGGRVSALGLEPDVPSNLKSTDQGADTIVVVPEGWQSALQGLVAHRQGQGQRVVLASLTDVADEFAGGNVDDLAIRDMVSYAYAAWQPPAVSSLLLVGEPNLDGRNDLDQSPYYNFMPTHYGVTDVQGETMTDTWFGSVSGNDLLPDVAVGRFSVRSPAEAQDVADKVIDYETGWPQGQAWAVNVVQIASDEAAFEASLEAAAESLPGHFTVDPQYRRDGATSGSIEDAFDAGAVLASLTGHGNVTFWADSPGGPYFDVGDATDLLNAGRLPLVTALNCLNGLIAHPFTVDSLAEVFHNRPDHGALAMWSPSSLGFLNEYDALQTAFYRILFVDRVPGVGRATNLALVETWLTEPVSIDLVKEMVLLGDPAGWLAYDTDADTLPDAVEQQAGLPAGDADGDDDGVVDGAESDPFGDGDGDGMPDPADADADNDALPDGLETGVVSPGPDTDLAAGAFVPDLDPGSTTDPADPDTDGGGAPDGVEDLDGNGRVDPGETDPENPADDPACATGAPGEIAVLPGDLLSLARIGDDIRLTWGDASAADACLLYRVYVADDLDGATGKPAFRLLGSAALPQYTHVGGGAPGSEHRYVVVGFSLAAGEGPWGHYD